MLGDGPRCAADRSKYTGPCADRPIKMVQLSTRAKIHWTMLCNFQWPCKHCEKNYRPVCPSGWDQDMSLGPDSTVCIAQNDYVGPCERRVDFALFNSFTKEEWSQECIAYWPCKH